MGGLQFILTGCSLYLAFNLSAEELRLSDAQPLRLPPVGSYQLRVLGPALLELTLVTTKQPDPARVQQWGFVLEGGKCQLPDPKAFAVSASGKPVPVKAVGFKRRVLYAPLKQRDLRIGNYIYLQLAAPVAEGQAVEVRNPDQKLWPPSVQFTVNSTPFRWSPVLHVNQTGYLPASAKKAMVGYYLGSLGEMDLQENLATLREGSNSWTQPSLNPGERAGGKQTPELQPASALRNSPSSTNSSAPVSFQLLDVRSNKEVFRGTLTPRLDRGFPMECYQRVLEADFTSFQTPGEYRLFIPGLGTSYPFFIDDAVAGAFARTYALGLYHQRCGTNNVLPFTRFTHGPCHTAPAEVPTLARKFRAVNESLAKESAGCKGNPRHTAPQLKNVAASLYPFVNPGPVDVRGGHHDAGDYSKYTINSASFIHHLVFAVDAFPGVSGLDNLGLPESGDGKSDVLQEAKWEADFLAKMQDADGGFYFLVYPREREYEDNVTPDRGDPQIVFPKTTSVTAAATAALAQCASSPTFRQQFPEAAARYLAQAKKGWAFLERAIARHGKNGAYQRISHYGDEFMHDDELAWAACEMFLATGEPAYQEKLMMWFNPANPNTRRWSWWRLYDAYGCTIRSYSFAARTGRLKRQQLNPLLLEQCDNEVAAAGEDQLNRARNSAYGTSLPEETKRSLSAGWYFSADAAFDLAVACQVDYPTLRDPRPQMKEAIVSNLNYEQGCNPVNVTYLTGLGWKRQREIVHQYAWNDRRILPPTGIPLGNVQAGFGYNWRYQKELDLLSFPSDGTQSSPYPFYDRWGDGYNLSQEFVILNQARALSCCAWLMAQTPLKSQPWKSAPAQITGWPATPSAQAKFTLGLSAPGVDLSAARTVWEAEGREPVFGQSYAFVPAKNAPQWVETEAQLPDGRRVFGVRDSTVTPAK